MPKTNPLLSVDHLGFDAINRRIVVAVVGLPAVFAARDQGRQQAEETSAVRVAEAAERLVESRRWAANMLAATVKRGQRGDELVLPLNLPLSEVLANETELPPRDGLEAAGRSSTETLGSLGATLRELEQTHQRLKKIWVMSIIALIIFAIGVWGLGRPFVQERQARAVAATLESIIQVTLDVESTATAMAILVIDAQDTVEARQTSKATTTVRATPHPTETSTPLPSDTAPPTPASTPSPSSMLTQVSTPEPVPVNTVTSVPSRPIILTGPANGTYASPITFTWTGPSNLTYRVVLRHSEKGFSHTSPPLNTFTWSYDIPAEEYGNWTWWIEVAGRRQTQPAAFVFDPYAFHGELGIFDFNGDCRIDEGDLGAFQFSLGCSRDDECYSFDADLNQDGYVGYDDYNEVARRIGRNVPNCTP